MEVNKSAISLREGKIFLDGEQILEAGSITINYQPEVVSYRTLGERGLNRRWIGRDVTGSFTEYKSTPWLENKIKEYEKSGKTPELTIQGIRQDKNSDYYQKYKKNETVTCSGAVLTGDLPLLALDTQGQLVQQTVNFGAKDIAI